MDIAYGYEENDTKTDAAAVRELTNLAARYPDRLSFTRRKSTHAKVLFYDDVWVTTSFNWLSFKGNPKRAPTAWTKDASSATIVTTASLKSAIKAIGESVELRLRVADVEIRFPGGEALSARG